MLTIWATKQCVLDTVNDQGLLERTPGIQKPMGLPCVGMSYAGWYLFLLQAAPRVSSGGHLSPSPQTHEVQVGLSLQPQGWMEQGTRVEADQMRRAPSHSGQSGVAGQHAECVSGLLRHSLGRNSFSS